MKIQEGKTLKVENSQKGLIGYLVAIIIAIVVIALIIIGVYSYEAGKQASVNQSGSTATTTDQTATSSSALGVQGMSQYTDTAFGFSFWYPSSWHVNVSTSSNNSNIQGGSVIKNLTIGDVSPEILIQEVASPSFTITDTGGAGPIGPVTYSFVQATHTWMIVNSQSGTTSLPADISINTMGGLHMFAGTSRFDSIIIPLSAENFVVIKDNGGFNAALLAKTVVALDTSAATPVSISEQNHDIQSESNAYAVQTSADWKTYYSGQFGFSFMYPSTWKVTEKSNKAGLAEVALTSNLDSDIVGVPAEEVDFSTVYQSYFNPPIGTKYGTIGYDSTKKALVDTANPSSPCLPASTLLQIPNALPAFTFGGSTMSSPAYFDSAILTKNGQIIVITDNIEGTVDKAADTKVATSFTLLNGNSAAVPSCTPSS